MTSKLYVPVFGEIYAKFEPYKWLMIRVVAGALMIPHGYQKLFVPGVLEGTAGFFGQMGLAPAVFWVWVIALLEFVGGIMLVVGFLTRPVAAMVVGFMTVAVFHVHWGSGFFVTGGGYEYALMWGILALAILIRGAGNFSVDKKLGKEF